jgi:hypothetical protein
MADFTVRAPEYRFGASHGLKVYLFTSSGFFSRFELVIRIFSNLTPSDWNGVNGFSRLNDMNR